MMKLPSAAQIGESVSISATVIAVGFTEEGKVRYAVRLFDGTTMDVGSECITTREPQTV